MSAENSRKVDPQVVIVLLILGAMTVGGASLLFTPPLNDIPLREVNRGTIPLGETQSVIMHPNTYHVYTLEGEPDQSIHVEVDAVDEVYTQIGLQAQGTEQVAQWTQDQPPSGFGEMVSLDRTLRRTGTYLLFVMLEGDGRRQYTISITSE